MAMSEVTCVISTRRRHTTTLPAVLFGVLNQTVRPNAVLLFNDSDSPPKLLDIPLYRSIQTFFGLRGIALEEHRGAGSQVYNFQVAQFYSRPLTWRLDDDTVPDQECLAVLKDYMNDPEIGAAGPIVVAHDRPIAENASNAIQDTFTYPWKEPRQMFWQQGGAYETEHLVCSYLFRTNIAAYNLDYSPMSHCSETQHSHEIHRKGYRLVVAPQAIVWHTKEPVGGVRDAHKMCFQHDVKLFQDWKKTL